MLTGEHTNRYTREEFIVTGITGASILTTMMKFGLNKLAQYAKLYYPHE